MERIIFGKEEKRKMVKNLDANRIRNGRMSKVYWKILEYNTVVLENDTGSLEA